MSYNSAIDFRVAQNPPDNLDPKIRAALVEPYQVFQTLIQAIITNTQAAPLIVSEQAAVATQAPASTILSGNLRRLYVEAEEDLSFGMIISLHNVAGDLRARKANATNNTKIGDGFCSTAGGILTGAIGEVQLSTGIATIGGLTIASRYWLSTTSGLIVAAAPVAAGNIEQLIGIALTTTQLYVNMGAWIQH